MTFEEYFSFEAIVGDLIRWRVKGKGTVGADGRRDVEKVLPPRKAWSRVGAKERKIMDRDYEWSDVLLLDEKAREYEKQGDYAQAAEAYLECLKAFETCEISVYMSSVAEAGNKAEANFDRCIGLLSEGETRQKLCDQMDAFRSSLYGG